MIGYKSYLSLFLSFYGVLQQNKHVFDAEENPVSLLVHQSHWKVNACPCDLVVEHFFLPNVEVRYLLVIHAYPSTQSIQIILQGKDT